VKLVVNCPSDWKIEDIKEVIKAFCSSYGGGLKLVDSGPNIMQGSAKKYKGTFTIVDKGTSGKDVEIDYDEGSTFKHGTYGKKLRKIFWENLHSGLKNVLEKPHSSYK